MYMDMDVQSALSLPWTSALRWTQVSLVELAVTAHAPPLSTATHRHLV